MRPYTNRALKKKILVFVGSVFGRKVYDLSFRFTPWGVEWAADRVTQRWRRAAAAAGARPDGTRPG